MSKTMTLNLSEREMAVLTEMARQKELTKTAVMRQALRLYQLVDHRLSRGDRLFVDDGKMDCEMLLVTTPDTKGKE